MEKETAKRRVVVLKEGEPVLPTGKVYEIRSPGCELGAFVVVLLPADAETGDEIDLKDATVLFYGDASLAGDLIGPQVIKNWQMRGANIGIILNPDEEIEFGAAEDDEEE